ncbi:UNVERIFIED_CONTAM: GDSL esterase/lipase [Sesamum calycinum]|uniref:GDSL esterase/lipase n=1 Tax=Sesamum calycinum TaxID=2727403 RepID=A0AAW2N438_9LAMI
MEKRSQVNSRKQRVDTPCKDEEHESGSSMIPPRAAHIYVQHVVQAANPLQDASTPLLASEIRWPTLAICFCSAHPATRPHLAALPTAKLSSTAPGRFSDGRLIIDFIAESLGLPFVEPYFAGEPAAEKGGRFSKGVNFAVAAATALENGFLEKRGIHNPFTNVSLETQLHWFKQFVATIPADEEIAVVKVVGNGG